jgi:hypothetical protein
LQDRLPSRNKTVCYFVYRRRSIFLRKRWKPYISMLNDLQLYCFNLGIKSTKKTKIMIFEQSMISRSLEIVTEFKYLAVTLFRNDDHWNRTLFPFFLLLRKQKIFKCLRKVLNVMNIVYLRKYTTSWKFTLPTKIHRKRKIGPTILNLFFMIKRCLIYG